MKGLLSRISPWDETTYGNNVKTLRVLIECEKGSIHKYEYDSDNDMMVIVRDLDSKYPYIYNYGSIPQTLADDGDSLDAIVMADEPIRSGTVVNCIPLAILRMIDNGEQDDKVLCIPYFVKHGEIDINKVFKYLQNYKYPYQSGTELLGIDDASVAIEEIEKTHEVFIRSQQ